jgi:hypothetical protein
MSASERIDAGFRREVVAGRTTAAHSKTTFMICTETGDACPGPRATISGNIELHHPAGDLPPPAAGDVVHGDLGVLVADAARHV